MYQLPKPRRYLSPEEIQRATAMAQGTYDGHVYTASEAAAIFRLAQSAVINQVPAFEKTANRRHKNRTATATTREAAAQKTSRRAPSQRAAKGTPQTTEKTAPAPDDAFSLEIGPANAPESDSDPGKDTGRAEPRTDEDTYEEETGNQEVAKPCRATAPPAEPISTLPKHDYKTGQTVRFEGRLYNVITLLGKEHLVLEDDSYNNFTVHSSEVQRPNGANNEMAA